MKILFPVSLDPSREDALQLACATAGALGAGLRALFVVDAEGIGRAEAGAPPGAIHIARLAQEAIVARQAAEGEEALARIRGQCRDAGVAVEGEVRIGSPRVEVEKAAAGCDLLVTGLESRFAFREADDPCRLAVELMNDKVVPLLLAASPYRPVETVVVGCGGGLRTARAVGAMARLGLWKSGPRIVLLAVDDSPEGGERRIAEPARILRGAGYSHWETKIVSGPKVETFASFCDDAGADAVVLGGWGERRWNELLGFSITDHFLRRKRHHLFLYM